MHRIYVLPALALMVASAAAAAPRVELRATTVNLTEQKTAAATAGRKVKGKARPGDRLAYMLVCRNAGDEVAREAVVTDPIPRGTVYQPGSATEEGATVVFSIDDGKTFRSEPILIDVLDPATGKTVKKPAPPERYTHIRWTLTEPLPAGAERPLRFTVRVK